jgi:hypothetical protein
VRQSQAAGRSWRPTRWRDLCGPYLLGFHSHVIGRFRLPVGLRLGLGFPLHPRGVLAAGVKLCPLRIDPARGLGPRKPAAHPAARRARHQRALGRQPQRPEFPARMSPAWGPSGPRLSRQGVRKLRFVPGCCGIGSLVPGFGLPLWRPGLAVVDGGQVLALNRAVQGVGVRLELPYQAAMLCCPAAPPAAGSWSRRCSWPWPSRPSPGAGGPHRTAGARSRPRDPGDRNRAGAA